MRATAGRDLATATGRNAVWALGTASLVLGALSLLAVYVGSPPVKLAVLASTLVAALLLRRRPVFPFGYIFTTDVDLPPQSPVLRPLAQALETQRTRWLAWVSFGWFSIETAVGILGFLENPGFPLEFFGGWPMWLFFFVMVSAFGVAGTSAILWLSFHLVALALRHRGDISPGPKGG